MDLATIAYQFRKEKGLSMEALAELMGVSTQTVFRIERGDTMALPTLVAFSKATGISLKSILTLLGIKLDDQLTDADRLNALLQIPGYGDLLELMQDLDSEELEQVRAYAAYIKSRTEPGPRG